MNFEEKLKQVFKENNIEILTYTGEKNKIVYRCLNCDTIYSASCARSLFSKISLCRKCYNPFTRWNAERLENFKLKRLYPNSDLVITSYNGLRKGCDIKCNKCGAVEHVNNLEAVFCGRKDYFCNSCEKNHNKIYNHMLEQLEKGQIELLQWNGVNEKSQFQCKRCHHIFEKKVNGDINQIVCPNCRATDFDFSFEDAQKKLNEIGHNEYNLLQYKGIDKRILIKHKCGFCFTTKFNNFKNCPKCF